MNYGKIYSYCRLHSKGVASFLKHSFTSATFPIQETDKSNFNTNALDNNHQFTKWLADPLRSFDLELLVKIQQEWQQWHNRLSITLFSTFQMYQCLCAVKRFQTNAAKKPKQVDLTKRQNPVKNIYRNFYPKDNLSKEAKIE